MTPPPLRTGFRAIALYEAGKGGLVLVAGLGLLSMIHGDVQALAERIVRHTNLDPASKYPRIFLDAASRTTDTHLWIFAGLATLYAAGRFVLAYGLWFERRWAEWLALATVAVYLPVESYGLIVRVTWIKSCVFLLNLAIVLYIVYALRLSSKSDQALDAAGKNPPPDATRKNP